MRKTKPIRMALIGFDSERLKSPQSGLGKFCEHLGKALVSENRLDFQFFQKAQTEHFFPSPAKYVNINSFNKIIGVPAKVDLWHCTHQLSNYFPIDKSIPIVSTIHDLNFLHGSKEDFKKKRQLKKVQRLIDKSSALVFISQFTADEVAKHLNIEGKHTEVIYNAPALGDEEIDTKTADRPYFFSIGLVSEKKNFHTLLPLLSKFPKHQLVIAGNNTNSYAERIKDEAKKHGVSDRLVLTGEISESQKLNFYKNCEAFLMPSLAEGFCLPVIEAMHFGKPVFLSSIGALKEVGANEAYYWTNFESRDMIEILQRGLDDFNQNKAQREQSMKLHASLFSWEKAAQAYTNLYEKMLADESVRRTRRKI